MRKMPIIWILFCGCFVLFAKAEMSNQCIYQTGSVVQVFDWWADYLTPKHLEWPIPRHLFCLSQSAPVPRNGSPESLIKLITWKEDDWFLWSLVRAINSDYLGNVNANYYKIATNTLFFVQKVITYTHETDEYWQTPTETLMLRKGDCEDSAILYVALLYALQFPVAFGYYYDPVKNAAHLFGLVQVHPTWVAERSGILNKCWPDRWTIVWRRTDNTVWAIAETTYEPKYWLIGAGGLGCGSIPMAAWQSGNVWMIDMTGRIYLPPDLLPYMP